MGLKSGSRDTGLDDEEAVDEEQDRHATEDEAPGHAEEIDDGREDPTRASGTSDGTGATDAAASTDQARRESGGGRTSDRQSKRKDDRATRGTESDTTRQNRSSADETHAGTESSGASQSTTKTTEPEPAGSTDDRPSKESIPYKLRREKVNEDRDQVPFFLREEVVADERDLRERLEENLGETVYKSDYREAAMIVAQEHPDLVAEVLRRWGYDL
ncbi:MAG: hypothetical protein ABEI99_11520 [Halobaculum sp.]